MESNNVIWRLGQVERKVETIEKEKADLDDLRNLVDEVRSLRKALIAFALSGIGTGMMFLIGVITLVVQQHGS